MDDVRPATAEADAAGQGDLDGLLVIDKPEGPTSHDVVARTRRLLKTKRVGHTGTLDPMATGVLPLVLGRATRLAQFLTASDKRYRAVVRLGQATDTYDKLGSADGPACEVDVTDAALEAALVRFRGPFLQTPPAYSAKKIGGVSAHRLARAGEAVVPQAVPVTVHELSLVARDGALVTLDVRAAAGFYVRSLAHDLGQALGCGGHLEALRRTASGELTEADAVPLGQFEQDPAAGRARIIPMARLLPHFPAVRVTAEGAVRVRRGQALRPFDLSRESAPMPEPVLEEDASGDAAKRPEMLVRVLGPAGDLLALARPLPAGLLHPGLVLV